MGNQSSRDQADAYESESVVPFGHSPRNVGTNEAAQLDNAGQAIMSYFTRRSEWPKQIAASTRFYEAAFQRASWGRRKDRGAGGRSPDLSGQNRTRRTVAP